MKHQNRIKELRKAAGYSQAKTAELLGISDTAFQNYEYGTRDVPGDVVAKMADLFNTSSDYILMATDNPSRIDYYVMKLDPEKVEGYADVPVYGSIAAGTPIEMIPVDEFHQIPAAMHARYPHAFLLRVQGESMNRVLPNGCYALIDPREEVAKDNDPYAICVNGYDATIKRVKKLANGFQLVPDSTDPTYPVQTFNYNEPGTDEITVIGKVVWHVIPFDWAY